MNDRPKSVFEHLVELRPCIVNSAYSILISMIVCYVGIDSIFDFITYPLTVILKTMGKTDKLVYTSVSEIFSTHLRIAFYSSLTLCFPYISFEFWKFLKPALSKDEIKKIMRTVFAASILFVIGAAFAYYIAIPNIFMLFMKNNLPIANFLPKIGENVSFIVLLMFVFGLSFQMPLLILSLDRLKILRVSTIQKLWREVILVIVIVAAIVTPPDAFSMFFLAAPLILLFIISILVCKFMNPREC
ncbi:MAG: twin-arginine translocase subunit TatC [Holosporales bacterium]|jgi:sec-independent protein translocase protein TatC|nr:twin-arginine translocase subunit TatC [Holosporales bacterium]